jgi:hypothetical protein
MSQNPYSSPTSNVASEFTGALQEAPGARASFHCGLWGLITILFCLPASLILGIIALVQASKAKRFALSSPNLYVYPSNAGMIMGIISVAVLPILFIIGMISAIAIPALLGQRTRARDKVAISNVLNRMPEMVEHYNQLSDQKHSDAEIQQDLETYLQETTKQDKNPWDISKPAFSYSIFVVTDMDQESIKDVARTKATELGQGIFIIQFPTRNGANPEHSGILAGATQLKNPISGSTIFVKVTDL